MLSAVIECGRVVEMWLKTLALIATVITGASFGTNFATAQTRVVTSDATAQLVPLEVGKFIVIDLAADAKDVVVANPTIANVVLRTARRAVILATGPGQTNIAFYDDARRQIEALDVTVQSYPVHPATLPSGPENVVIVFRGPQSWLSLSCTQTSNLGEGAACYSREEPAGNLKDLPPGSELKIPVGK
jgi:hypothetical protein